MSPAETDEEFPGIHETVNQCIMQSDLDLRPTLYSNIYLAGGSTMFPGFGDRLLNELKVLAPKDIKIRLQAPPERKYSVWMGGSILASLTTFNKLWVTASEYEENGVGIIHKKTF